VALGAIVATASLALTGCSGGGSAGSGGQDGGSADAQGGAKTLTVWVDADRAKVLKDVAAKFTKESGVKIKLVQKDNSKMEQDMISQIPTGKGPDIAVGANDWTGQLVTDGVIQPVELGDKTGDYEDVAVKAFTYDGKVYALPYSIENIAILRNTKLAPKAATSWKDMMAKGKKSGAQYPFLVQVGEHSDPYTLYPLQSSFGGGVFAKKADGSYDADKLTIGDDSGVAFAKWLKKAGQEKLLSTSMTPDIAVEKFDGGKAAYWLTGPWNVAAAQQAGIDVAIDPIPSLGGKTASPFVGVQGFFISSKTKNKIAANDFLVNYLGTESVQKALYKVGNRPPALKSAFESVSSDPIMQGFETVSKTGTPMPNVPAMAAVWQYWGDTEAAIIDQKGDPAALWKKMTSNIQSAIDKQ